MRTVKKNIYFALLALLAFMAVSQSADAGLKAVSPSSTAAPSSSLPGSVLFAPTTCNYSTVVFTKDNGYANGQPEQSRTVPLFDASTIHAPTWTTAKRGDIGVISVAGTFNGLSVSRSDYLIANKNSPTLVSDWDVVSDCTTAFNAAAVANAGKVLDLEGTFKLSDANPDAQLQMTGNAYIFNPLNHAGIYQTSNDTYATTSTTQVQATAVGFGNYTEPNTGTAINASTYFTVSSGAELNYHVGQPMTMYTNAYTPDAYNSSQKTYIREAFHVGAIDTTNHRVYADRRLRWHDKITPSTITASTIAFVSGTKTITDSGNGFVTAGFDTGDSVTITGSASNNKTVTLKSAVAGTLTLKSSDTLTDESAGSSVTISYAPLVYINSLNTDRAVKITGNITFGGGPSFVGQSLGWFKTLRGDQVAGTITAGSGTIGSTRTVSSTAHGLSVGDVIQIDHTGSGGTLDTSVVLTSVPNANSFVFAFPDETSSGSGRAATDYQSTGDTTALTIPTSSTLNYAPAFVITNTDHIGGALIAEAATGSYIDAKGDRTWGAPLRLHGPTNFSYVNMVLTNDVNPYTDNRNVLGRLPYGIEDSASDNEIHFRSYNWGRHPYTSTGRESSAAWAPGNWYRYGGNMINAVVEGEAWGSDGGDCDTHEGSMGANITCKSHFPFRKVYESSYQGHSGGSRGSCEVRHIEQIGGYEGQVLRDSGTSYERQKGCVDQFDLTISDIPYVNSNTMAYRTESTTLSNPPVVFGTFKFKNVGRGMKIETGNATSLNDYEHRDIAYACMYLNGTGSHYSDTTECGYSQNTAGLTTRYGVYMGGTSSFKTGTMTVRLGSSANPTELFTDADNASGKTVQINVLNVVDPNNVGLPPLVTAGNEGHFTVSVGTVIYNGQILNCPGGPGVASGKIQTPLNFSATSTRNLANGTMSFTPICVPKWGVYTALDIYVTAATSIAAHGGLYTSVNGLPSALISGTDVTIATLTAAAENSFSFSTAKALYPGWVWGATLTNGTATVNSMSSSSNAWTSGVTDMNTTGAAFTIAQAYGALPSTLGALTRTDTQTQAYMGLKAQ